MGLFLVKLSNYNGKAGKKQRGIRFAVVPSDSSKGAALPLVKQTNGGGEGHRNTRHRFENCGALRAFLSPYFRRSLQRESLRRNPFSFKGAR